MFCNKIVNTKASEHVVVIVAYLFNGTAAAAIWENVATVKFVDANAFWAAIIYPN